jgi:polysaccharide export outer membrane protein
MMRVDSSRSGDRASAARTLQSRAQRRLLAALALAGLLSLCGGWGVGLAADNENKADQPSSDIKASASAQVMAEDVLISPNDLLFIQVFDVDQLTREYRLSPTGVLTMPLLREPINATGLTANQLAEVLSQRFREAGVLNNPQIAVLIRESHVHSVTIGGAVRRPQMYPLFGRTTLLDVLSQAEGVGETAGSTVTITRGEVAMRMLGREAGKDQAGPQPGVPRIVTIDLRRLLDTGDPSLNVDVFPGDRVTVEQAGIFYVVGAVNRSGGYPLKGDKEEMTVLKAIALAEDVKPTAMKTKAKIIRKNPSVASGREEIRVNLKAILAGKAPDKRLLADDILFVPDSTSKRAGRKAAEAAVYVATGLIIWGR